VQELLRVADRFQAGGLYEHCLAAFGWALTVETVIPQLVWARGCDGVRVANCRAIRVGCVRAGRAVGAGCWRRRMRAARALWTVDLR